MDTRLQSVRDGLHEMYPGYFALVMATGIVSNAFFYLSHDGLSDVLFAITLVAFPILLACFVVRVLTWPRAVWRDLVDPRLVFTFFTLVAAFDVVGLQLHLRGQDHVALGLWLGALTAWVALGYFSFAVLTFDEARAQWLLETSGGDYTAPFVVAASGILSVPLEPDIPGMRSFAGQSLFTSRWPDGVDVTGKRVGVIGTGFMGKCHSLAYNAVRPTFGDLPLPVLDTLCDIDPEHARRKAEELGFARSTADRARSSAPCSSTGTVCLW